MCIYLQNKLLFAEQRTTVTICIPSHSRCLCLVYSLHTLVCLRLFSFRFRAFDTQEFVNNFQLLCVYLNAPYQRTEKVSRARPKRKKYLRIRVKVEEKNELKKIPSFRWFSWAFHCAHKNTFYKISTSLYWVTKNNKAK